LIVVEDHDITGGFIALASGHAAVHVALGFPLPFDDEDGDRGGGALDDGGDACSTSRARRSLLHSPHTGTAPCRRGSAPSR
jgi:hypothetical protein